MSCSYSVTWRCSSCGFSPTTSAASSFYRDADGNVQDYEDIGTSDAALAAGLYGFRDSLLCLDCGETSKIITREYETPIKRTFPIDPETGNPRIPPLPAVRKVEPKCPHCGSSRMVLDAGYCGVSCPKCKSGRLIPESKIYIN